VVSSLRLDIIRSLIHLDLLRTPSRYPSRPYRSAQRYDRLIQSFSCVHSSQQPHSHTRSGSGCLGFSDPDTDREQRVKLRNWVVEGTRSTSTLATWVARANVHFELNASNAEGSIEGKSNGNQGHRKDRIKAHESGIWERTRDKTGIGEWFGFGSFPSSSCLY
jgi:hypothetical protein